MSPISRLQHSQSSLIKFNHFFLHEDYFKVSYLLLYAQQMTWTLYQIFKLTVISTNSSLWLLVVMGECSTKLAISSTSGGALNPFLFHLLSKKLTYCHFPLSELGPCCCSVAQLCPSLSHPMDCSTPGFSALHCLPEFAQTHLYPLPFYAFLPIHTAMTRYHRLGGLNKRLFFFSQFWRLKTWDQGASLVKLWWGPSSWLADWPVSHYVPEAFLHVFTWRESEEAWPGSLPFLNKGINPMTRIPLARSYLNLITCQRHGPLLPTHRGLGLQCKNLVGDTNIQSIANTSVFFFSGGS